MRCRTPRDLSVNILVRLGGPRSLLDVCRPTTQGTSDWHLSSGFCAVWTRRASGTAGLLKSLQGTEFQVHLERLKEKSAAISWPALLSEFTRSVPTASDEDAKRICTALADAGVILRNGHVVYLRPAEVAAALNNILPTNIQEIQSKLTQTKAELDLLEMQRMNIMRSVRLRSSLLNYLVFAALAGQYGLLFRLTYWELSWDVVEPIGFFLGGVSSMASLLWFMRTRQEFSYGNMHRSFLDSYERKVFERTNFNFDEYRRLQQETDRLGSILTARYEEEGRRKVGT